MSQRSLHSVIAVLALFGLILSVAVPATATATDKTATASMQQEQRGVTQIEQQTSSQEHVHECAATPPADYSPPAGNTSDVIGWVDGYWYNEPVHITSEDGLNESERDALTRRTAARVEALRCLTFESVPPVEVQPRSAYRETVKEYYTDRYSDTDARQFDSALLATKFFAGQHENATALRFDHDTGFATAYYSPAQNVIRFVSETPNVGIRSESILAHELVHALQDQNFELLSNQTRWPHDQMMAERHVIERDATLVEDQYRERCQLLQWTEECLRMDFSGPDPASWGLQLTSYAPYHTPLVKQIYEKEGWDGVNALYEQPPSSMATAIHPETYGAFEREELSVPDQSTDSWHRTAPAVANGSYQIVGQHGLTAMFAAPAFTEDVSPTRIYYNEMFTSDQSFDYLQPETTGWAGDRFYGYANGDGKVAGVWKLAWNDTEQATLFANSYTDLVAAYDGKQATDYANVYTFEESDRFEMAIAIEQRSDRVLIVMAPTVTDLTAVHDITLRESQQATPDEQATQTSTPADSDETTTPDESQETANPADSDGTTTSTQASEGGPGFGVIVAILAVSFVSGLALRTTRRTR